MGKIKAVACYKLDRISRKTSDLMRLLEYFERHDVTLLVCSNNINTQISTSKIIIQVLAIIAEFERDILTERIQDNLMELAKDGRWLGGKTPTGFSSERVTTGSGKNKSAVSFLVTVLQEKTLVQEIYSTFWELRSLLQTTTAINEKYETKHGSKFTTSTIRLILRNPIYCVADEFSYNYFLEKGGNLFGDISEFDGQHGLSSYNKTDQMKVEDEDSTFFNPKFSQLMTQKPVSEWIISVGRHEGFIPSRKWVETQKMLDVFNLESSCTTNSSSETPSTALKSHFFSLTPGQAYLKRGLPFVHRFDSGSTRSRLPQIGQYISPDKSAFVFRCGRLYFSAIS